MRKYLALLLAFCVVCVGALVLLRPGPGVRLEADVLQLPPEEGLALLEKRRTETGFSDSLYLLNARLAAAAGEYVRAEALYRVVLMRSQEPLADVLDELARLALISGAQADATTYLSRAYLAEPTAERRRTLALRYRGLGDVQLEADLLQTVDIGELDPRERDRLADLMVAAHDVGGYERILRDAAALDDADAPQPRAALLSLMLETGRDADALKEARGWVTNVSDPAGLSADVLMTLLQRGAPDAAAVFAFDAIAHDPDLGSGMPIVFARSGYGVLARAVQTEWLNADTLISAEDWDAVTAFAAQTGDLSGLQRLLGAYPDSEVPAEAFMVMLRYDGPAALVPYRARLTATIDARPLVGAALAAWAGQQEKTYTLLKKAARPDLSAWDREIWTQAAWSLKGTAFEVALATGNDIGADYRALAAGSEIGPSVAINADRVAEVDKGD